MVVTMPKKRIFIAFMFFMVAFFTQPMLPEVFAVFEQIFEKRVRPVPCHVDG